jgi:hypothetical protein
MKIRKVILLGREQKNLDKGVQLIKAEGLTIITCTSLEKLKEALEDKDVDTVITGAGLPLDIRLQAAQMIFEASNSISVHMKDFASGPEGFGLFANKVLQ